MNDVTKILSSGLKQYLQENPDMPYYTIEVSNDYVIMQCHGFRNDRLTPKPDEIKAFEREYQHYLEELKSEQQRISIKSA